MAGKAGGLKGVALIGGGGGGNSTVAGALHFFQDPSTGYTEVRGRVTGLAPGLHGFHIHSFGDTTNGCNSTGPHFNPNNKSHGAPSDDERHVGDLGNIVANKDGVADIFIKDLQISLSGPHSILGRAVVVHADSDDLGRVFQSCLRFGSSTLSVTTSKVIFIRQVVMNSVKQQEMQEQELGAVSENLSVVSETERRKEPFGHASSVS
uniref:superoxide dismutase n=1 Tax=Oryza meridionalis TaxID=40149 RepID=A0A0E0CL47_9ORYZ